MHGRDVRGNSFGGEVIRRKASDLYLRLVPRISIHFAAAGKEERRSWGNPADQGQGGLRPAFLLTRRSGRFIFRVVHSHKEDPMAETQMSWWPERTCHDCGEKGVSFIHGGPLMPKDGRGDIENCGVCWRKRDKHFRKNGFPMPRGANKPAVPVSKSVQKRSPAHECGFCFASYPDVDSLYRHQQQAHDPDGIMFSEIGLPK